MRWLGSTGQTGYPVGHTPTGTHTSQRAAEFTYDTGYKTAAAAAATHSTAAGTLHNRHLLQHILVQTLTITAR